MITLYKCSVLSQHAEARFGPTMQIHSIIPLCRCWVLSDQTHAQCDPSMQMFGIIAPRRCSVFLEHANPRYSCAVQMHTIITQCRALVWLNYTDAKSDQRLRYPIRSHCEYAQCGLSMQMLSIGTLCSWLVWSPYFADAKFTHMCKCLVCSHFATAHYVHILRLLIMLILCDCLV